MASIRKAVLSVLPFPLFIIGSIAAAWLFRDRLFSVFSSAARVRETVEAAGSWGAALFVALQILQVVVFVIPGEIVQIAGGWLFGVLRGSALSIVGICAGSIVNFLVARVLGKRFVETLFGARALDRFEGINRTKRASVAFFLLFLIPGIPKDALCFAAGLSSMRPLAFLAVSMAGRLPGIVGSSVMGQAAYDGRYILLVAVAAAASLLFGFGAVFRERIHDRVAAMAVRREPASSEEERRREGA